MINEHSYFHDLVIKKGQRYFKIVKNDHLTDEGNTVNILAEPNNLDTKQYRTRKPKIPLALFLRRRSVSAGLPARDKAKVSKECPPKLGPLLRLFRAGHV